MDANFERALSLVLVHEGGWADHPRDPGGATMKGVTLATFQRYRPGATKADLRNISDTDVRRIYRDGYWNKVRGDDLPAGLDYAVFDYAVNSGPARAAKHLQSLVGVPQDGIIGPLTLAAVKERSARDLIEQLCAKRLTFLKGLSTWDAFGKGWQRRVDSVRKDALLMAVSPVPQQPDVPTMPEQPSSTTSAGSSRIPGWIIAAGLLVMVGVLVALFTPIF